MVDYVDVLPIVTDEALDAEAVAEVADVDVVAVVVAGAAAVVAGAAVAATIVL